MVVLCSYLGLYIEFDQWKNNNNNFNDVWDISLNYYENQEFAAT